MKRLAIACSCLLALAACDNALYYYDKANLAVGVEGRPDPTGPVQVTIAYKQRTVIVSPPKCGTQECLASTTNDALAMLGSFHASHSGAFGKTVIRTAFLTGNAAIFDKDDAKAQQAAVALSGASALPTAADNATLFIEAAKKKSLCSQISAIFRPGRPFEKFEQFTLSEQATLKQIDYYSEDHIEPLFTSMQQKIGDCK